MYASRYAYKIKGRGQKLLACTCRKMRNEPGSKYAKIVQGKYMPHTL